MIERRMGGQAYFTASHIREKLPNLEEVLKKRIYEANTAMRRLFPAGIRLVRIQPEGAQAEIYEAQTSLNPFGLLASSGLKEEPKQYLTKHPGVPDTGIWRPLVEEFRNACLEYIA